jgi:transcriptional regulator with GAF, ATPase, and Fis domain
VELNAQSDEVATEGDEQTVDEDQRAGEEDDLRTSIESLATLATEHLGLEDLLTEVATFAVRAIPGADGAGLALLESGRSDTVVMTAPFVGEIDDIQYGIRQGPCISAAADMRTVTSGSLGGDTRWPRFGARAARLGVHSALSLPLLTPTGVVGAINVYAHAKHAFDERSAELGELFAVPAAIAVQNAQVLAEARRLATSLQYALDTRAVVDRAVGILMSRSGVTDQQALARLRGLSQHEHHKLVDVAQSIVDEAVRRARSRHSGG